MQLVVEVVKTDPGEVSIPLSRDSHCNEFSPVETMVTTKVSIPLSRDSHCNQEAVRKVLKTINDVSIPLSRDSHCNRVVAEALISNSYNRLFF